MVTGDSQEEVIIFRDKQTDMHHNIYIIIIIVIITSIIVIIIIMRMCRVPLLFPPLQTPTRLVLFQEDHVEKLASVVFKRRKRRLFSSFFVGAKHPWVINICKFRLTPAIP